jgi:predicted LPLAT superfamily acyltransferase
MSATWLAEPERGSERAIGLIVWIALKLGRATARALLLPICLYFFVAAPRARRASRAYLARVLGRKASWRAVIRHQHTFAAAVLDRLFLVAHGDAGFDIRIEGPDEIDRALAHGRGCILLGSHLGSFEVLRTLARLRPDHRVSVVMSGNAEKTGRVLTRIAPELDARVIAPGRPDTLLKVKECLDAGEIVGILGDRPIGSSKTLARVFLGEPASFPLGPMLVAATLNVPVVLFFGLYRGGNRYDVHLEMLSAGARVDRAQRDELAAQWLTLYVARLEHYVRAAPYNWFNFYDFWHARDA